ncbi:MAG: amidohydrolase family protein [Chloroflexi bacterium]|nr:amidohydrolase family protein [Chloroflexota bacterium]
MIDLLLTSGTVVTMDPARSLLEDGAVAIDGGRVVAVGPSGDLARQYQARKTLDCRGKAVLPGLIDAHGHGGHSLIKTIGADTPTFWMRIVTPTYFHYTTPEYWYADGLLSALERLRFGVTCGVSVMGSMPRSDDPRIGNNHARAYAEVGVREVVCVGPCAPPWPHPVSVWDNGRREDRLVSFDEVMAGAEAVIETWNHGADDRIRVFITPFTIVTSVDPSNPTAADAATSLTEHDRLQARRVREAAARFKTRIHSDAFAGMVRMAAKDEYALLGPDVHIQHLRGISLEEVQILAATGTHATHAASAGQAGGRCPVPELIQAGVNVAITTDGTSPKVSFDLFQAMRKAQLVHQLMSRDMFLLPPGKLLEMVTIDAARALGWDDEIGSLEVGKKADVIVVDLRQPHLSPNFMVVHRLIYEAVGNDVETVIVDGRVVMENRAVLTVEEPAVLDRAQEESEKLIERAGLQRHLHDPGWGRLRLEFDEPIRLPETPRLPS